MRSGILDLRFGPGSSSGFTPSGIAGFSDLRPAAVVRELIQNALDAATEAEEETAEIRFRLIRIKTAQIPGMVAYKKAFKSAIRTQKSSGGGTLPSQAARVVDVMKRAMNQEEQDVLLVFDNGIGLDNEKLTALLSDGISNKGASAMGTFGNGHTVAIPASDLRYVLYGGVTTSGDRIGAGHAVLASSNVKGDPYPRSGDGFLVKGFKNGSFDFAMGNTLPDLIKKNLDDIEQHAGHGTVVVIPGFNNFKEDSPLLDMVFKAAACSFFQAIGERRLVVQFEDCLPGNDKTPKHLDSSTLATVLEANKEEKRSIAFLSGQKAFQGYEAYRNGTDLVYESSLGKMRVRIQERDSGNPRVDLCRNGMWITDDKHIPGFYYKFQDRKPFHALLLLDSRTGGQLHELIRNAEGPLHDKLDVKQRLSGSEARQLRTELKRIREWLRSRVTEMKSDSYSPEDFLAIDFGEEGTTGDAKRSFWGNPTPVARRDSGQTYGDQEPVPGPSPGPNPGPGPSPNPTPSPRSSPVLRHNFQATSVPIGLNRRRITLECLEGCQNAELRLCVDENLDATCDFLRRDQNDIVNLTHIKIAGKKVKRNMLVKRNGQITGVRLGNLEASSSLDLDISYELPSALLVLPGQLPALRVEVFRVLDSEEA